MPKLTLLKETKFKPEKISKYLLWRQYGLVTSSLYWKQKM